jgi:hypothetical protein
MSFFNFLLKGITMNKVYKYFSIFLLLLSSLAKADPNCSGQPYAFYLNQVNGAGNSFLGICLLETGSNAIAVYDQTTHDANWITIGSGLTYNSSTKVISVTQNAPTVNFPSRSLNSTFQISTTQNANVVYGVDISVTSPLLAGAQGTVFLEYADDSAFTTNVKKVSSGTNSTAGVLNLTNVGSVTLTGFIPASKYVRIRTQTVTGSPSFTIRAEQQEVLQ